MSLEPRFSIIIPAHNEEERIGPVLRSYVQSFADSEIIVVLNGCTDRTLEIVSTLAAAHDNLAYVEVREAIGKGGAVRVGMVFARAAVVGYADADGATPAAEMRRLCESLQDGQDGVIGSRWLTASQVHVEQPFVRRLASRVFNLCVRALFGLPFHDTQCGAKVFRAPALRELLPHVETSNLAFDVDLLYHLRLHRRRVVEIPTVWRDQLGSRVKLASASGKMLAALLRLRIRDSVLRTVIPSFDRLFPTGPIRMHEGLSILIVSRTAPGEPGDAAHDALCDASAALMAAGHNVEWLYGGRLRAALRYLRRLRDRFDVLVEAGEGLPAFSPLFSMKPKLLVAPQHARLPWPVRMAYRNVRRMPLEQLRESAGSRMLTGGRAAGIGAFEQILWTEVAGERLTLVRSGTGWSLLSPQLRQPFEDGACLSVPVELARPAAAGS